MVDRVHVTKEGLTTQALKTKQNLIIIYFRYSYQFFLSQFTKYNTVLASHRERVLSAEQVNKLLEYGRNAMLFTESAWPRRVERHLSLKNISKHCTIYRGYYTVLRRYEFYVRVVKSTFYEGAQRVSKIFFSAREDKIHVFKPPCNVLFII